MIYILKIVNAIAHMLVHIKKESQESKNTPERPNFAFL